MVPDTLFLPDTFFFPQLAVISESGYGTCALGIELRGAACLAVKQRLPTPLFRFSTPLFPPPRLNIRDCSRNSHE
jgi:hypothetical protein